MSVRAPSLPWLSRAKRVRRAADSAVSSSSSRALLYKDSDHLKKADFSSTSGCGRRTRCSAPTTSPSISPSRPWKITRFPLLRKGGGTAEGGPGAEEEEAATVSSGSKAKPKPWYRRHGKTLGLDVDGQGNLYVADASTRKVMVYNREIGRAHV